MMFQKLKKHRFIQAGMCRTLYFWPLIVAGRLAGRIFLNLWNLIEK